MLLGLKQPGSRMGNSSDEQAFVPAKVRQVSWLHPKMPNVGPIHHPSVQFAAKLRVAPQAFNSFPCPGWPVRLGGISVKHQCKFPRAFLAEGPAACRSTLSVRENRFFDDPDVTEFGGRDLPGLGKLPHPTLGDSGLLRVLGDTFSHVITIPSSV